MYALVLVVVDVLIFVLLWQISAGVALLFLIAAVVSVPALILYRREAASAPDISPGSESVARGWLRLCSDLGLDATGVALAVLILVLLALALRQAGHPVPHR